MTIIVFIDKSQVVTKAILPENLSKKQSTEKIQIPDNIDSLFERFQIDYYNRIKQEVFPKNVTNTVKNSLNSQHKNERDYI